MEELSFLVSRPTGKYPSGSVLQGSLNRGSRSALHVPGGAGPWDIGLLTLRVAGHGLRATESRGWLVSGCRQHIYPFCMVQKRWGEKLESTDLAS